MPTRRYPLHDGRQVEITDPVFSGRAYIYIDGEYLGEETIHELKGSYQITLPDGGRLLIHVVNSIPFFRLFDLRHNGIAVRRSAFARKFMFIRCLIGAFHFREHTPEIREASPQKMPQVTLG